MTEEQGTMMLQALSDMQLSLTDIQECVAKVIVYNEVSAGLMAGFIGVLVAGFIAIILAVMLRDI